MTTIAPDESFAVFISGEEIEGTSIGLTYISVRTPIGRLRMTTAEANSLSAALAAAVRADEAINEPDGIAAPIWEQVAVITAYGTPAGQGQISFLGKGRGAKHTNEKTLKPWRKAIITAAQHATGAHSYADWDGTCARCHTPKNEHGLYTGPTAADITITVPKPKSAPKRRQTWPITRYSTDIDHHARACLDSLSASGVIRDDSQITELTIRKVYPSEHPQALPEPGAIIRLYTLTGDPK